MQTRTVGAVRGAVLTMQSETPGQPRTPASGVPVPPKGAEPPARPANGKLSSSQQVSGVPKSGGLFGAPPAQPGPGTTRILHRAQDKFGGPLRSSSARANPQSARISLAGIGQGHWSCARCNKDLPKDALAKGLADLANGTLLCTECRNGGKKKEKTSLKFLRVPLAVTAVLAAAAAVFFPGYILFVLGMASVALILTGSLAFTHRGVVRLILAGLGLCGLVVSVWSLSYMRDRQALRQEEEEVGKAAAGVYAALKEGSYLEAQSRYRCFMAIAMPTQGCFRSPLAEKTAGEIRQAMDKWLKNAYGGLSVPEASVLANLMTLYGEKTAGGSNRFSNLKLGEDLASLRVVLDAEANPQNDRTPEDNAIEKARAVLKTLHATFPDARRYELSLAEDNGGGEAKEYGTIVVLPGQESVVEMGGDLHALVKK